MLSVAKIGYSLPRNPTGPQKKKPDLTIEKVTKDGLEPHLFYELKKEGGARIEDALTQTTNSITETMDQQGSSRALKYDAFVVIQRGMEIAFFEYHNDASNLNEEGVDNVDGCVSLTQTHKVGGVKKEIIPAPEGAKLLFREASGVKLSPERKRAKAYTTPCVLDLRQHEKEIDFLFHYMATNDPRTSY